jgi:hypothetical protein
MKSLIRAALAAFLLSVAPFSVIAQPTITDSGSISGDDADGTNTLFGDAYGAAFATIKDWVFVGAPRETTFRDGSDKQDGAVYIYRRNANGDFDFEQKLTRPGNSVYPGDRFGSGIDAAGNWLFVAAANDQDFPGLVDPREGLFDPSDPPFLFAGQVHVYQLNKMTDEWVYKTTLTSPIPRSWGQFGARTQESHIALNEKATIALIGELHNYPGGLGELHSYYRDKNDQWEYVETIPAPSPELTSFGDSVVSLGNGLFLAGGISTDLSTEVQQSHFVFKTKGKSGQFNSLPVQTISGPIYDWPDCFYADGTTGIDAGGDAVVIADPCFTGTAGNFSGVVNIYRIGNGKTPLMFETAIEGDESDLYFGSNFFSSRFAVAMNSQGDGLIIGSPLSPSGGGNLDGDAGADVRYWTYDNVTGLWSHTANLTSAVVADFRMFGDTVWFADDGTVLARHNNIIDPYITGLKGDLTIFDVPSPP